MGTMLKTWKFWKMYLEILNDSDHHNQLLINVGNGIMLKQYAQWIQIYFSGQKVTYVIFENEKYI